MLSGAPSSPDNPFSRLYSLPLHSLRRVQSRGCRSPMANDSVLLPPASLPQHLPEHFQTPRSPQGPAGPGESLSRLMDIVMNRENYLGSGSGRERKARKLRELHGMGGFAILTLPSAACPRSPETPVPTTSPGPGRRPQSWKKR